MGKSDTVLEPTFHGVKPNAHYCAEHEYHQHMFDDGTSICVYCLDARATKEADQLGNIFLRHTNLPDKYRVELRQWYEKIIRFIAGETPAQMIGREEVETFEQAIGTEILELSMRENLSPAEVIQIALQQGPAYLLKN